jgi:hypothetical protein
MCHLVGSTTKSTINAPHGRKCPFGYAPFIFQAETFLTPTHFHCAKIFFLNSYFYFMLLKLNSEDVVLLSHPSACVLLSLDGPSRLVLWAAVFACCRTCLDTASRLNPGNARLLVLCPKSNILLLTYSMTVDLPLACQGT